MRLLTTDELIACAQGMRQGQETALGLQLWRFSAAELAYYDANPMWGIRARCSAGVVLDFITDSETLSFAGQLGDGARAVAYVDLYVDGQFVDFLGDIQPDEHLAGSFRLRDPRTPGLHRVTLYLPHTRALGVRQLGLAEGASFTPAPAGEAYLALGDSITQGMDSAHPSLAYPMVAARQWGLTLHNSAIGGHVFDADSLPERPVEHPTLITVAYGTNDWSRQRNVAEAGRYLTRLRSLYPDTPVSVLSPLWRTGDNDGLRAYRQTLEAIVGTLPGMTYLPMETLLPTNPAFLCDGLHPDTTGHLVYGLNVARQVPVPRLTSVPG